MVSVVTGAGVGLQGSSRDVLGGVGGLGSSNLGRAGAQVTVNGANGNLVVQGRDEHLVGVGPDVDLLRTYNSQGGYDGDNGDGWRLGYYRRLRPDAYASGFVKIEADGHEVAYSWDATTGRYTSNEGSGAQDSLRAVGATWVWRDGDTGTEEVYEADPLKPGELRLSRIQDSAGHRIEVSYASGLISRLSTYKSGAALPDEVLTLNYSGTELGSVSTSYLDETGQARSRTLTRYEYQGGRLSAVITDLTPEDGSVADGKSYVVRYEYDAAGRLKKISQTDGSTQVFEYDAGGRVKTATDALNGVMSFSYDEVLHKSTVTDELGRVTQLQYDGKGQLTDVSLALPGGTTLAQRYVYNEQGDLLSSTNAAGETTRYEYGQGPGLWTRRMDSAGGVVERRFDSASRLVSETVFEGADPDGLQGAAPATGGRRTQYVYVDGSSQRLAYVVGPQGEVSRYEYNALAQLERQTRYTSDCFPAADATLAALDAWVAGPQALTLDRQVTSYAYDLRGQVKEVRSYAQSRLSSGLVVNEQVTPSYTVYDAFGRLLSRLDANGNGVSYGYDGLDRVITQTDADKVLTLTAYDDVQRKTRVQFKNGQVNLQSFDQRGLLVGTEVLGGAGQTSLGLTRYVYDAAGQLRQVVDATGVQSWSLYDASGRKSADIAGNGQLTEYVYDGAGRLLQSIAYAQLLGGEKLSQLSDAQGKPSNVTVSTLRPVADAQKDRIQTFFYDAAGRQVATLDAEGALNELQYNAAGDVVAEVRYANLLPVLRMDVSKGSVQSAAPALVRPAAHADDRRTQNFMDSSGRLVAKLDAQGALTRWTYDAAGRVLLKQRSAVLLSEAQRSAATLQTLQAWPTDAQDELTQWVYDRQGRQIAQLSSEGYLSTYGYDEAGRLQSTRVYLKQAVATSALATRRLTMLDLQTLPATLGEPQTTLRSYNKRGLLDTETAPDGTVTQYVYDALQRLEKTVRAAGTSEERAQQLSYDSWGRLADQRTQGDAQGVQTTYDAAGRVVGVTNALGASTYFYYDAQGRQVYSILVDAQLGGEVSETVYSAFSQVQATIRHSKRLSVQDCVTLKGGLQGAELKSKVDALTDPSDAKVQYSYNRRGQVQQAIDQLGARTDTRYNAFGEVAGTSADVDLAGQGSRRLETNLAYDRLGRVVLSTAGAAGALGQTRTAYDALGRLQSSIDALGQETRYSYVHDYGQGRQVVVSDAAGERRTSYDALNRVVKEVDRLGNAVSYQHDAVNRELTITTSSGLRTVTRYTRHGEVWQLTDGAGQTTRYEYDSHGQLVQVTDASGVVSRSSYDLAGNLTERVVGLKLGADGKAASTGAEARTRYSFDAANRLLVQTVDPDGLALQTKYAYDGQGRQLKVTDATNAVSTQRFDSAGHLVERVVDDVSGGLKLKTTYSYDAQGRVLSVVEGAGTAEAQRTDYVYDELGRRTAQIVDPLGLKLKTSYEYDAAGRLVRQLDASAAATVYRYDSAGRLQYVVNAAGGVTRHTVDANGQLSSVRRYATALAPNWNALSLPALDAALAALAPSAADELSRQVYDADGRLVYTVDAAGGVTESQYDGAGRVTLTRRYAQPVVLAPESLTRDALQRALVKDDLRDQVSRQSYDAAGRLRFVVDAEGGVTETRYDAAGRVTETVQYARALHSQQRDYNAGSAQGNWYVYDNANGTANGTITREWDAQKGADVTRLSGSGTTTGYQLGADAQHNGWSSATRRLGVEFKFSQPFVVYLSVTTTQGHRYLQYQPGAAAPSVDRSGEYVQLSLGDVADGQWHTLDRDLQADLRLVEPGAELLSVDGLLVRGSGAIGAVSTLADAPLSTDQLQSLLAPSQQDRHTRLAYDAAGRARFEVNAEGYVTERQYDALGRVRQTLRYARALPALLETEQTTAQIGEAVKTAGDAVRTLVDYDAAGRLSSETNGAGSVTRYTYDAANRLSTEVQGYGTPEVSTTRHGYDAAGRRVEVVRGFGTTSSSTTRYEYDAMGRLRFEYSPRGIELAESDASFAQSERVRLGYPAALSSLKPEDKTFLRNAYKSEWRYDALGRITQSVDALGGQRSTQYDALGHAVVETDARGYSSYQVYDKLGRVVQRVDAERYLTVSGYDAFGQLVQSLRVDARVQGALAAGQPVVLANEAPASGAYVLLNAALDHLTLRSHDRANRLLSETDAEGFTESVLSWDAFGQKLQVQNKLQGVARFSYDKLGRVSTETLPEKVRDANGQWCEVVNEYRYDARGNRILSIEARGLAEERRTEMRYDGADRLVRRIGQSYTAMSAQGVESTVTPADSWRYDARGNLIETIVHGQLAADGQSVSGLKRSLAYYDVLGRKVAEITPDRVLSRSTYDAAGNLVAQTVYATPLAGNLALTPGGTPPDATVDLRNDRTLRTTYDVLNRKITLSVDSLQVWEGNADNPAISSLSPQTVTLQRYAYDAVGNATERVDGRGFASRDYFDGLGRRVMSIDSGGAVTSWVYGRAGAVATQETRHGRLLASGVSRQADRLSAQNSSNDPAALLSQLAVLPPQPFGEADRITRFTLDRLDRLVEKRVLGVAYDDVDAQGRRQAGVADAVTQYEYNGLGGVTSIRALVGKPGAAAQEQVWEQTALQYDKLGREVRRSAPGFVDFEGSWVRPRTELVYDGLGRAVRRIQFGKDDATNLDDQVQQYRYDASGQLTTSIDAENAVTTSRYDAEGNLSRRTAVSVRRADGSRRDLVKTYSYDAVGRETAVLDVDTQELRRTRYNAFGEVAAKGLGEGWEEFAEYNTVGKVIKTNAGDGAIKFYVYDANGNVTREIRGNGDPAVDLIGMSLKMAAESKQMYSRISVYNSRNLLVKTMDPQIEMLRDSTSLGSLYSERYEAPWTPSTVTPVPGQDLPWTQVDYTSGSKPTLSFRCAGASQIGFSGGFMSDPLQWLGFNVPLPTMLANGPSTFTYDLTAMKGKGKIGYSCGTSAGQKAWEGIYGCSTATGYIEVDANGNVTHVPNQSASYKRRTGDYILWPISPALVGTSKTETLTYSVYARDGSLLTRGGSISGTAQQGPVLDISYWAGPTRPTSFRIDYTRELTREKASLYVNVDSAGNITTSQDAFQVANKVTLYVKGRDVKSASLVVGGRSYDTPGVYVPATATAFGYTRLSFDIRGDFAAGTYGFSMIARNAAGGNMLDEFGDPITQDGQIVLGDSGSTPTVLYKVASLQTSSKEVITKLQEFNAFGEVVEERDERVQERMLRSIKEELKRQKKPDNVTLTPEQIAGARTTLQYNALGKLIAKIDPETWVTAENGYRYRSRPVTRYGYDLIGRHTTTLDANGKLSRTHQLAGAQGEEGVGAYDFDAMGGSAEVFDGGPGKGGILQRQFDVFGNLRRVVDAELGVVEQAYDKMGRLLTVTRKNVLRYDGAGQETRIDLRDSYEYDELGQRIRFVSALANQQGGATPPAVTTDYDGLGRIVRTATAGGAVTEYRYQQITRLDEKISAMEGAVDATSAAARLRRNYSGGYIKETRRADGRSTFDKVEYFGHTVEHADLTNSVTTYVYNSAGQLARQSRGYRAMLPKRQAITYSYYANGYIRGVADETLNTQSTYTYDNAGNRISEAYANVDPNLPKDKDGKLIPQYYQNSTVLYDELNRIERVDDVDRYNIRYEYDAVGNRRMIDANYWDGPTGGRLDRQTYWYAYDAMNRFVVSKGQLTTTAAGTDPNRFADAKRGTSLTDSSVSIISGEFGIKLGYDRNSQRISAQYIFNGATTLDTYKYSGDGYLQLTSINGVLKVTRELDALGRTVAQHDVDTIGGGAVQGQHTRSSYDWDNRLLSQNFVDDKDGKRNYSLSYSYYAAVAPAASKDAWDASNAAMSATGKGALAQMVLRPAEGKVTTTTYTYEYWDDAKQFTIVKANEDVGTGTTQMKYDVNGNLLYSNDAISKVTSTFVTTANGLILMRERRASSGTVSNHNFFYVDSHRIGDVGNTPDEIQRVSYAEQLALKDARRSNPDAKGRTYRTLISKAKYEDEDLAGKPRRIMTEAAVYGSTADFDQNYEPINDNYPGHAASLYTVQRDSETLASIAQTLWGDAAMWYLIADANGLTASATLKSGQLLVIPNKVTNIHNNAKTWRPYQAGEAIGKTDPTMPTPPPPRDSGCGGLGMLLMVVVAVAVTVYTAGALTAGVSGGFGATMSAGASALAGTGLSLGTAVAVGAASAAVGSIASQAVGLAIGQIDSFSWRAVGQAALGGAITSGAGSMLGGPGGFLGGGDPWAIAGRAAIGSGVNMALRGDWNWKTVMISAVSAGVGSAVGGSGTDFGSVFTRSLATGVTATALSGGNRRAYESVFISSLGSALGESLASTGVDWRNAPDESAAESARLGRQQARTFSQDAAAREAALDPMDIRGMYASNGAKVIGAGLGYSAEDRAFDRMLLGDELAAMAAPQPSLGNESSDYLPFSFLARDGSGHFAPQNPVELFGRHAVAETGFGEGFKAQVSETVSGAWAGIRNFGLDTFDGWRGIRGTRSGFYRSVDEMGFAKTLVYYGAQATLAPWMTGGSIVDSGVRTAGNLSKGEMGAAGRSTAQFLEGTSAAALSVLGGRQGLSVRGTFVAGERIAIAEGFALRAADVDASFPLPPPSKGAMQRVADALIHGNGSYVERFWGDLNSSEYAAIRAQIGASEVGGNVLRALDRNEISLKFSRGASPNGDVYGVTLERFAEVYLSETSPGRVYSILDIRASGLELTASTGLHEGLHAMGVAGSRRAEALVRLSELQSMGVPIDRAAMRQVLSDMGSTPKSRAGLIDPSPYDHLDWLSKRNSQYFPNLKF